MENSQTHIFAVCDGHGDDGHSVSQFITSKLADSVKNGFKKGFMCIPDAINYSILKIDTDIDKAPVDSYSSGSTLTGVFINGTTMYPFNVGDSRSILIKFKTDDDK